VIGGTLLVWPWLTLLTHSIFRQTMRRARILPVHVLRCLVYIADAAAIGAILFLAMMAIIAWTWPLFYEWVAPLTLLWALGCACALIYRMIIAWNVYLSFPDAASTCIACQVIVVLAMLALFFNILAPI